MNKLPQQHIDGRFEELPVFRMVPEVVTKRDELLHVESQHAVLGELHVLAEPLEHLRVEHVGLVEGGDEILQRLRAHGQLVAQTLHDLVVYHAIVAVTVPVKVEHHVAVLQLDVRVVSHLLADVFEQALHERLSVRVRRDLETLVLMGKVYFFITSLTRS